MLILGVILCIAGGLLARYTIDPTFPNGAYAGMTRTSWRVVGAAIVVVGVCISVVGLGAL